MNEEKSGNRLGQEKLKNMLGKKKEMGGVKKTCKYQIKQRKWGAFRYWKGKELNIK